MEFPGFKGERQVSYTELPSAQVIFLNSMFSTSEPVCAGSFLYKQIVEAGEGKR